MLMVHPGPVRGQTGTGGELLGVEVGGRLAGAIFVGSEGVGWEGTRGGQWGHAGWPTTNRSGWHHIALELFTVHSETGEAIECVSRLFLGAKQVEDRSDKPALGLGCDIATMAEAEIRLRLGSAGVRGVAVRDLYLLNRLLPPSEIEVASKRQPWNRWVPAGR